MVVEIIIGPLTTMFHLAKCNLKSWCALYYNVVNTWFVSTWFQGFYPVKFSNILESEFLNEFCILKPSWIFHLGVAWTDSITNHQTDGILKKSGNPHGSLSSSECEAVCLNEGIASSPRGFLPVEYDLNDNIYQILEGTSLC